MVPSLLFIQGTVGYASESMIDMLTCWKGSFVLWSNDNIWYAVRLSVVAGMEETE